MSDFHQYLARQCAVGREKFGPNERSKGVREHIMKEFDEIDKETTASGRANEWVDVAILGLDGLLRAVREMIREDNDFAPEGPTTDEDETVIAWNGEPTNDFVAAVTWSMITTKQGKNELRDFGNWREASEDVAMEHRRGHHD